MTYFSFARDVHLRVAVGPEVVQHSNSEGSIEISVARGSRGLLRAPRGSTDASVRADDNIELKLQPPGSILR